MRRFPRFLSLFIPLIAVLTFSACEDRILEPEIETEVTVPATDTTEFFFFKKPVFTLTVLHHNDGESDLLPTIIDGQAYGSVASFATLVDRLRDEADTYGPPLRPFARRGGGGPRGPAGAILVSSGDNFLAGAEFNASLQKGPPYFDAMAQDLIGYDAIGIGNHEFDFGPETFANYVESFGADGAPFLSANLDFSGEPSLSGLVSQGRIAASTVVEVDDVRVGIIGATTTNLSFISSPGAVTAGDVASAVQREVYRLFFQGAKVIVLISHLQEVDEDLAVVPQVFGVDIVVSGGGDELLANSGDPLVPGDDAAGSYPLWAHDRFGQDVPVVTTSGGYFYLGRLVADFDRLGRLVEVREISGPVVNGPDIAPDPEIQSRVVMPVEQAVADLASTIIGTTEVGLNGVREEIRTRETNLGNLDADALVWQAEQVLGPLANPVGLQNGGGIRNDNIIGPGPISELNTFDINAFSNFVVTLPGMSPAELKQVLERAYSAEQEAGGGLDVEGRFGQISGMTVEFDPSAQRQITQGDGTISTPGERVVNVTLDDGTPIIAGGAVVPGAPDVTLVTIDFLANGGDNYPLPFGLPVNSTGFSYQQALSNYIVTGLGGSVTAADYPVGGEGRIVPLP